MDAETRDEFVLALRECGQLSPEQLRATEQLLAETLDDALIAEKLQQLGVLTSYQARKIRIGRFSEINFGIYLIQDKLGEGGMGKVYKAVQRNNGRTVALKVVRPHLMSNRTVLKRYQREAAAVSKLDHVNIVTLYDVDDVNGRYFLAMEYVDGIDLSRMVKEFGRPPDRGLPHFQEACEYIRQAALGLAHAHERELVHRDIKPSNILVHGERALPGTNGEAKIKVLDMGLVRSLSEDDDASRTELTRDGTVVGTPDYMAPEQAKNSSTVDGRADIYSLGCTLFFLLCGRPLYPDGSPIEKLLKHQVDPAPDLAKLRPDLPRGLVKVWLKMVEKDRDKRYQKASEVATALAPFTPQGLPDNDTIEVPAFSFAPEAPSSLDLSMIPEAEIVAQPTASAPPPQTTAPPPSTRSNTQRVTPPRKLPPTPLQRPAAPKPPTSRPSAPSVPGAMALPRQESAPSSESLPATAAPKTARATRVPDDTPTNSAERRRERERERRPQRPTRSPYMIPLIVGGALAAVMLLVVVAIFVFSNRTPSASTTAPPTEIKRPSTVPTGNIPPEAITLIPLAELVPDRTSAVLVLHPKKYLGRDVYDPEKSSSPKGLKFIKLLNQKMRFDARECNRITIPFSGPQNNWTVIGEGSFLKPEWEQSLGSLPKMQRANLGGQKAFHNLSWTTGPNHGVILNATTYAIATDRGILLGLVDRLNNKRAPDGLAPEIQDKLAKAPGPTEADIFFVAGPQYQLPDTTTLGEYGVRWMMGSVLLEGNEFAFKLVFSGRNKTKVKAFVSEYMVTTLGEKYPNSKALIAKFAQGETSEKDNGTEFELHLQGKITWASFHEAFEKILPELELSKD